MRITALLAPIAALVIAAPLAAADLTGKWKINGEVTVQEGMKVQATLTIKDEKGKLTGGLSMMPGAPESPLKGEVKDKEVSWVFSVDYNGQSVDVEYKGTLVSDDEIKGSINGGGQPVGTFTATREKAAAPAKK